MAMKRIISIALSVVFLVACGVPSLFDPNFSRSCTSSIASVEGSVSLGSFTLETALPSATDVVIAQCVGMRYLGEGLKEFEFVVLEGLWNSLADRIFIYASTDVDHHVANNLRFSSGTDYLLPLRRIPYTPYSNIRENGFTLPHNIAIDLNNPSSSRILNQPLSEHSENLAFDENTSREEVVSFIRKWTRRFSFPPAGIFIRSEEMEDIFKGSPDVWVIEVNDPLRLSEDVPLSSSMVPTDIYFVTIVQSLKGDKEVGDEGVVVFFADTVQPGERRIVAVSQIPTGSFYDFTSRSSLFSIDQLEEIMMILDSDE